MLPPGDESVLREAGLSPSDFTLWPKPGPPPPLRRYVGNGLILTVADGVEGRRQNQLESAARRWARGNGIAVPIVRGEAADGSWLLADHVRTTHAEGSEYVEEALSQADRIRASVLPALPVVPSSWEAPRSSMPQRIARLVRGGVSLNQVRRVRAAAAQLPSDTTCHGDFYRRNVLASEHGVRIVDWEFVGSAPDYTDHLRLWSTLKREEDRAQVIETLLGAGADRAHVGVLAEWLGLRLLMENLSAPPPQRNPRDLAHARVVAEEGTQLREQL